MILFFTAFDLYITPILLLCYYLLFLTLISSLININDIQYCVQYTHTY